MTLASRRTFASTQRATSSLLLLTLFGCASAGAPAPASGEGSVVDVPAPPTEAAGSGEGAAPRGTRSDSPADFAAYIEQLRGARDVSASGDERALYDDALAGERAGDRARARVVYFELVSKHPTSSLIPYAYLSFGEMFAEDAARDPSKRAIARQAFLEVAKYPPPGNGALSYALLRRGEMEDDGARALDAFAKALEGSRSYADAPCSALIGRRAEERMVEAYADVGKPERAFHFFSAKGGKEAAPRMLLQLADAYAQKGDVKSACAALSPARGQPTIAERARNMCSSF